VYFPLIASAGLFSLFLVFTFFKEYVTVILTLYAVGIGTFSTASMITPAVNFVLPGWFSKTEFKFTLPSLPHIPVINPAPEDDAAPVADGERASHPASLLPPGSPRGSGHCRTHRDHAGVGDRLRDRCRLRCVVLLQGALGRQQRDGHGPR
jgi:hypothetical protein